MILCSFFPFYIVVFVSYIVLIPSTKKKEIYMTDTYGQGVEVDRCFPFFFYMVYI